MVWTSLDTNLYFQIHRAVQRYLTSHRGKCSVVMLPPNTCEKFSLLSFVLLIYFLTARCGRAVQDELSGLKTVLDIFSIASYHHGNKATTCGKRPRLQYPDISGWTQWSRQLLGLPKIGAKSTGKCPIAGI